ncbi:helix-turn-helix transcriptional regulator [Amycolatopsis australiensis]|uniref:Regulatory protein, luxR family n=1 Tax=Amycolatopsis australiensis TaxID=546364 RepID=A0A1K1SQ27_9PSEU|nr:LuxR C-terminal-related transcriptional regulator [Amycolatopsis australiensis]SFW86183.1 regulatory protein, luxR family [Amycolatopsis australiensis]
MSDAAAHPPKRGVDPLAPAVTAALARLRAGTGVNLAFAGQVTRSGVLLNAFDGPVVGPLRGVLLGAGQGVGGRVAYQQRALSLRDYVASRAITHRYDQVIRAEALRAMAAAPVVVARRTVAVLYVALRTSQQEMGRLLDAVSHEARALEQDLAVTDVLRRLRDRHAADDSMRRSRVAEAYADLRALAGEVGDPRLRERLLNTAGLLVGEPAPADAPHLTAREQDVLALLSTGLPNQAVAERLGIGVYTVKDHVKNLLAKLGARGRMEAVTQARRLGLLP